MRRWYVNKDEVYTYHAVMLTEEDIGLSLSIRTSNQLFFMDLTNNLGESTNFALSVHLRTIEEGNSL